METMSPPTEKSTLKMRFTGHGLFAVHSMPEAARTRTFRSLTACLIARLRGEKTIEVADEQAAWELALGGRRPEPSFLRLAAFRPSAIQ